MNLSKAIKTVCFTSIFISLASYALEQTSSNGLNVKKSTKSGQQTADYMNSNYNKIVENCGSSTRPAFLCSGILFRATNPDTGYNSWDPSPASISSGGVSFSYLRKDAKFDKLAYGYLNGFVFYPYSFAPEGKDTNIDVICTFPIDADTVNRADNGCGSHKSYPSQSGACQSQGITSADGWFTHYNSSSINRHQNQCGFTTSENSAFSGTSAFYQALLAMSKIPSESLHEQNEMRLATWNTFAQDYPENLPIEAFFYIYKQNRTRTPIEKGLEGAQNDQQTYFNTTGIWIPIIRMSLPIDSSQDANFSYSIADQKVQEPEN